MSSEIRNLADKTKIEINKMSPVAQSITSNSDEINKNMNNITIKTDEFFNSIKTLYNGMIKINNAFNNLMTLAKKIE